MFFANLSIQDSVLLNGQMLEACLTAEVMTSLMATENLLSWMMCLAKEKKKILLNAHIDQSATVIIMKML
jgi:hypothetical protein